jgi:hypothetical protein
MSDGHSPSSSAPEHAFDSVVCEGGTELNFDAPFPCVSAALGGKHKDRCLIVSKAFPIPAEQRQEFVNFVKSFDWEDHYWLNIPNTVARELTLTYLRSFLTPCSSFWAEKYLQLSYIVHQRFVAGDDETPAEHFALACAIGRICATGEDTYRADLCEHGDGRQLDADVSERSPSSVESDRKGSPASSKSDRTPSGKRKRVRVSAPVVPQDGSSVDGTRPTSEVGGGVESAKGTVKSKPAERDTAVASYLDKLAAEVQALTARLNSEQQRSAAASDQTSTVSNLALDKVIGDLRAKLPATLAEAAIKGLIGANDKLRATPLPLETKVSTAELGREYRIGALAAEDRSLAHHVNRVGARVSTKDGPESHMRQHDRLALLNPEDLNVLFTLRKVMRGGGEFSHLNSKQKMKAMARLVRRQLHEASLEHKRAAADKVAKETAAEGEKASAGKADCGDGSSSSGDSCSKSSDDSRDSSDSYQRDGFCVGDDDGDGDGDGGDDDGGSSGAGGSCGDDSCGDADSLDERDKRRAEKRRESSNSLGTPATKSRGKTPLALPAPAKAVEGDRPSLVLLGDEDLAMWKSGLRKYKMGFHWESYLYHKQQFDNYKAHRGRFSDRTFKSIIDARLVPTVCASCGFFRSRWAVLSDERLILRIERVLRPSKSTDFAMELKEIKFEGFDNEPLQASYVTFAEKFLAKVAEAADAGRPVKPVVVKAAYKSALDKEVPLKTWLEGDKWRGVDHAHKRLLRKLREARSWEAMTASVKKRSQRSTCDDQIDGVAEDHRKGFRPGGNRRRSNSTGKDVRKRRVNSSRVKKINATASFGGGGRRDSNIGKREQRPRAEKLRTWRGCDSRGDSWHSDKDLFECFKKPCHADFCQRCAKHGHTAEYCLIPEGTEGLNTSGYFQEQRPGKAGPRRPPVRSNSSGKRRGDAGGSSEESDDNASQSNGDGGSRAGTARRSNNTRGQSGRGRL